MNTCRHNTWPKAKQWYETESLMQTKFRKEWNFLVNSGQKFPVPTLKVIMMKSVHFTTKNTVII